MRCRKKGRGIYTLVLLFGKEKESLDRRLLRRPRRGTGDVLAGLLVFRIFALNV